METNTAELINQLSDEFSRLIVANFTADQLKEAIAKNHTKEYAGCCATHDYCDSNMVMNEAFENVMQREFIFWDDEKPETQEQNRYDNNLCNEAWSLSKSKDFAVIPCMSDEDEFGDIIPYSAEEAKRREIARKFKDEDLRIIYEEGFFNSAKQYIYTLEKGPDQYNPCFELHIIEGGTVWHVIQYFGKRTDAEMDIDLLQSLGVNIDEA